MKLNSPFVYHEKKLRDIAFNDLAKGKDHGGIESRFSDLLVLADRLLISCASTADHGDLPRRIGAAFDAISQQSAGVGADLLRNCLEAWFKALLHRVNKDLYFQRHGTGGRFNLYQVIKDLDLLSSKEIELTGDEAPQILDPVRRSLLLAKEHRNPLTHSAMSIDPSGPELRCGVVSILASIDRHRETVTECLRGLITRAIPIERIDLPHRIRSERAHRLSEFVGRSVILAELKNLIEKVGHQGGYIVVTSPEGFGKSAIASKLTECENSGLEMLGDARLQVARDAPWLPGALLHMGKQSKDPLEFVSAIVDQANTLLLRPVDAIRLEDAELASLRDNELSNGEHGDRKSVESLGHRFRAKLHEVLDRLVAERGRALVVIDALDEIGCDADAFYFLPELLPVGAVILMTTRPEEKLIEFLGHRLRATRIALEGFSIDEVNELTGAKDLHWNQKVHRLSSGAPLYVAMVAKKLKEVGGDYKRVDLPHSMKAVFQGQSALWRTAEIAETKDPLRAMLALLAVFEPATSLKMDFLQSFLKQRGIALSGAALREALLPVASQVEGLEAGKLKLAVKAFAEYVRQSLFTVQDLRELLVDITEWLAENNDVPDAVLTFYLQTWTDEKFVRDKQQRTAAAELVNRLICCDRAEVVANIFSKWRRPEKPRAIVPEFLVRGLEAAASANSRTAIYCLGKYDYDRSGLTAIPSLLELARSRFAKASALGHVEAMLMLGRFLLDGLGGGRQPDQGKDWLQQAMDAGSKEARSELAARYLDGNGLQKDSELGERLLRQAATENSFSKYRLAVRLIDGNGVMKNVVEGEHLFRSVAEKNPFFMLMLSERFLDGKGLALNIDEGERLIRDAAEKEPLAKYRLACRLIDGKGLPQNPEEGERLLRDAAAKHSDAKRELATRLLDGIGLVQSFEEGERLLREAALIDAGVKTELITRLLTGKGIERDAHQGEQLLREVVAEDPVTSGAYGYQLYGQLRNVTDHALRAHLQWASAFCFHSALISGVSEMGNNLAYIIRRREAVDANFSSLDTLLEPGLITQSAFPIVNQALREMAGLDCDMDWHSADRRFASLDQSKAGEILKWWYKLAQEEDAEGHLVVACLLRHQLISDPEGLNAAERFSRVRGAWEIPEWICSVA
jgi:TPR repeat protein